MLQLAHTRCGQGHDQADKSIEGSFSACHPVGSPLVHPSLFTFPAVMSQDFVSILLVNHRQLSLPRSLQAQPKRCTH